MHPHIEQLVEQLQWHAGIEGESLDGEYCQSLNPKRILVSARRAGLKIEEARAGITLLRDAKIGNSSDQHAQPLLTKTAWRLFSSSVWAAFQDDVRFTGHSAHTQPIRFIGPLVPRLRVYVAILLCLHSASWPVVTSCDITISHHPTALREQQQTCPAGGESCRCSSCSERCCNEHPH
jgi:hypothetical protein